MDRIVDQSELAWALDERRRIADDSYRLSEQWVREHRVSVVAQAAAGRIDSDQVGPLAAAAQVAGVRRFVAIANDDAFVDPTSMTYQVEPTPEDLTRCNLEFSGLNLLLFAVAQPMALLATVDDYSVFAGPLDAVRAFQPDRVGALRDFREFVDDAAGTLPVAEEALSLFETYDGTSR